MTMLYALREGLRIVLEEGIEPRIDRHLRNSRAFWAGVEAMGLTLHVEEKHRLTPLTTVRVPEGVDELRLRTGLLLEHNIEIGRGFGALEGQVWRIGLMGYGSSPENVLALLFALEAQLAQAEVWPRPRRRSGGRGARVRNADCQRIRERRAGVCSYEIGGGGDGAISGESIAAG